MKDKIDLIKIRQESAILANLSERRKNRFLKILAGIIWKNRVNIVRSNRLDVEKVKILGLKSAFIDRLNLDEPGIRRIIQSITRTRKLKSGIGQIIESRKLASGVILKKVKTPIGVILIIYESRPEVTIDAACLSIKSGNCAILKGGSEARFTNEKLYLCIKQALVKAGLSQDAIIYFSGSKSDLYKLLQDDKNIDLVIARGGYTMVKDVTDQSRIPVLAHSAGGARIYVDESADLSIASKVILNAKTNKPAACNSVDTVLVHRKIAARFIPKIVKLLQENGVAVIGDEETNRLAKVIKALDTDWNLEFLDLTIAIKIVKDLDHAIEFIQKFSKKHSEGIIAENKKAIKFYTS